MEERDSPDEAELALNVADSDVLIDYLRGAKSSAVDRIQAERDAGTLTVTVVSVYELYSHNSERRRGAAAVLLSTAAILPLTAFESAVAANIRRRLKADRLTLDVPDLLIAAICVANDHTLLTRNKAHFELVEELRAEFL